MICMHFTYTYRTSETQIKEQQEQEVMLAAEVEMAKQRMQEIQREMENVLEQLGEAKVDRHESSRAVRKAELIQNLKRLFGGVVSVYLVCACDVMGVKLV